MGERHKLCSTAAATHRARRSARSTAFHRLNSIQLISLSLSQCRSSEPSIDSTPRNSHHSSVSSLSAGAPGSSISLRCRADCPRHYDAPYTHCHCHSPPPSLSRLDSTLCACPRDSNVELRPSAVRCHLSSVTRPSLLPAVASPPRRTCTPRCTSSAARRPQHGHLTLPRLRYPLHRLYTLPLTLLFTRCPHVHPAAPLTCREG